MPFIDIVQWMMVFGVLTERQFELCIIVFLSAITAYRYGGFEISRKWVLFLTGIAFWSLVSITCCRYGYMKFLQQISCITVSVLCYSHLFQVIAKHSTVRQLYEKYCKMAVVTAWLGVAEFLFWLVTKVDVFSSWANNQSDVSEFLRIHVVFDEPGYFACFLIPAVATVMVDEKERSRVGLANVCGLIVAMLLTFATIGYFGIGIAVLFRFCTFLSSRKRIGQFIGVSVVALFVVCWIANSESKLVEDVRMKFFETYSNVLNDEVDEFESLNLSTFASLSNLWVARHAPSRLFGTGLGTHEISYDKSGYSPRREDFVGDPETGLGYNYTDAYSLATRIYSEFGLVGIALFVVWLIARFNKGSAINVGVFAYLLSMCVRGGHYFRYGMVFFVIIYSFTSKASSVKAATSEC